jgi:N-acetyl-anhydromuramyl-L-alanine amidase AmpD
MRDAVIKLCKDIQTRYHISPRDIVGHSDVAPARKQDPGEAFPWKKLAEAGVGIWTDEFEDSEDNLANVLLDIGYDVHDLKSDTPEYTTIAQLFGLYRRLSMKEG